MTLEPLAPDHRHTCPWRLVAGVAAVAVLVLGSGCSSVASAARTSPGLPDALAITRTDPARLAAAAAAVVARHEGDFTLTGVGDSMRPAYTEGTVLVVHPTSFFMLRAGMPVVYVNARGHQVAHVLLEECPAGWVAQGLNNREPDDDPVTPRNLVGIIRCAFVPEARRTGTLAAMALPAGSASVDGIALLR